ncbi:alpha/beta family hydrolase [Noviherbaspirillum sp. 1P10PC]|uniref:dienelactone hydrolase family protein n=1 Tax=Noviherbaspirillum sp. 1P10PC TaxID=3132292 RepID=UPI00399F5836
MNAPSNILVHIPVDGLQVEGMLQMPAHAIGLVLFAHGSGSSRLSVRNNHVAAFLREAGLGTLLIDLLTVDEDRDYQNRFDIDLLTQRLDAAATWLRAQEFAPALPLGLFGASTGAAAALRVAARHPQEILALVTRGGRPDLAGNEALAAVRAPSLLIVGGDDLEVIELNKTAYDFLPGEKRLAIIPGATHLFEEPGKLDEVAMLAANWFAFHFREIARQRAGRD